MSVHKAQHIWILYVSLYKNGLYEDTIYTQQPKTPIKLYVQYIQYIDYFKLYRLIHNSGCVCVCVHVSKRIHMYR